MKNRNTHSGVYSCPECCIEYELLDETELKCDKCEDLLLEGSLESLADDNNDEDEDDQDDD